ncbi:hypothetical protein GQX74_009219 [Glossina fuscipes]|nr:hypothetical protein GQX74_009219 [Glossina fuscipes]
MPLLEFKASIGIIMTNEQAKRRGRPAYLREQPFKKSKSCTKFDPEIRLDDTEHYLKQKTATSPYMSRQKSCKTNTCDEIREDEISEKCEEAVYSKTLIILIEPNNRHVTSPDLKCSMIQVYTSHERFKFDLIKT